PSARAAIWPHARPKATGDASPPANGPSQTRIHPPATQSAATGASSFLSKTLPGRRRFPRGGRQKNTLPPPPFWLSGLKVGRGGATRLAQPYSKEPESAGFVARGQPKVQPVAGKPGTRSQSSRSRLSASPRSPPRVLAAPP